MSTFSAQNFKIGPCTVIFKDEVLGETRNSSVVKFKSEYETFTNDQITGIPIIRHLKNISITFETEIMAIDKGMGLLLDANGKITMEEINWMREPEYGELKLIPLNPLDTTGYRFPRALLLRDCSLALNTNKEHSLKLLFDAVYDENELMFEEITVSDADRINLNTAPAIDPAALERAMTYYIADKLDMTVDTDVFRGGLPPNVDGCAVALVDYETPNAMSFSSYFIRIYCIDISRDLVMGNICSLADEFPVYGEEVSLLEGGSVSCKAMTKVAVEFDNGTTDDGRIKHFGELLLEITI